MLSICSGVPQEPVFLGVALGAPTLVDIKQNPGCWMLLETSQDTPQLILTWLDHGAQFKKTCSCMFFFLSNPLGVVGTVLLFQNATSHIL